VAFRPKVVIVDTPDERHFGSGFLKMRGSGDDRVCGKMMYYPLWSLAELEAARCCFNDQSSDVKLSPSELLVRFLEVGGIPGSLLRRERNFRVVTHGHLRSCRAIAALHPFQVEGLAKGDIHCSFSSGQVKSELVGYDNS
jgi:hypothetical protein